MTVDVVSLAIEVVKVIYNTREGVQENSEELKRFCRHAENLLRMIQKKYKDGSNPPPNMTRSLRRFKRTVAAVQDTVNALAKASLIRRIFCYGSLSKQIQGAYGDMNRLVQEFTLEQVIDMKAMLYKLEAAKEYDRRQIDTTCREVLERSNGGSDSRKLLKAMEIPPEEMEETLVSCSQRLKKGIGSSFERAVLSSVSSALEGRIGKRIPIPRECMITSLDVVIHREKLRGRGGYANVYEGTWQGKRVAVKQLLSRGDPSVIEVEVDLWRRLKHENIVRFYAACSISDPPFMVCELKQYGNINKYLGQFPQANIRRLLTDASLGLEYLHRENVIHGDIKGSNILVGENGVACLCDFGISRIKTFATTLADRSDRARKKLKGTIRWSAPEQIRNGGTSKEADIYSFAITMYEVYSGQPPYIDFDEGVVYRRVRDGKKPPSLLEVASALDRGLTPELWRIMSLSWRTQPQNRPSANTVAEWLKVPNAVYGTRIRPELDDSAEQSSTPRRGNTGEQLGEKHMQKPSKANLHASVRPARSFINDKSSILSPGSNETTTKLTRGSKLHKNQAKRRTESSNTVTRSSNSSNSQFPSPPFPQAHFQPTGKPFAVPLSALPGFGPRPVLQDTDLGTLFPINMGPPPPGAVPAFQLDHGTIFPMGMPPPGGGMAQMQPAGTFVPTGPPTLHFLAPPVMNTQKSKGTSPWCL
ncbi:kinase-like domain-containing protein [Irpex rosettiformis]|uniref:Kinase-like domain-containing protein n=1 Tax=Irpex rosettiformis TaxID=378272 RepID=A0ACB8U9X8_9APHY|nr:kinase-like domain-containing protein [Irpex rosettiformis]